MHLTKILLITSLALFSTSVALPIAVKENELAARSEDGLDQLFRRAPQVEGVTFTEKLKTTGKKVQEAAKNVKKQLSPLKKSEGWQELRGSPSPDQGTSTKPGGGSSSGLPGCGQPG